MDTNFKTNDTTFQFKTNINCGGCIDKITPFLDAEKRIQKWTVDTSTKEKKLTINASTITENEIIAVVQKAGFKIEKIG